MRSHAALRHAMHMKPAAITHHSTATCACALPLWGSPSHQLLLCLLCWVVAAAQQPPLLLPLWAEGEEAAGALLASPLLLVGAGCRPQILSLPPLAAVAAVVVALATALATRLCFQPPQNLPLLLALPLLPQVVGAEAMAAALLALPIAQQAQQLAAAATRRQLAHLPARPMALPVAVVALLPPAAMLPQAVAAAAGRRRQPVEEEALPPLLPEGRTHLSSAAAQAAAGWMTPPRAARRPLRLLLQGEVAAARCSMTPHLPAAPC